jgi:hypothetical protein
MTRQPHFRILQCPLRTVFAVIAISANGAAHGDAYDYNRTHNCAEKLAGSHVWSLCDYYEEQRIERTVRKLKERKPELFESFRPYRSLGRDDLDGPIFDKGGEDYEDEY